MKNITIEVDNCLDCPFSNNDNEYGCDSCNLNKDIISEKFKDLPDNKRHEKCPLNNANYKIVGI